MKYKNRNGRDVEMSIHGKHSDDLQCDGAEFVTATILDRVKDIFGLPAPEPTDADIDYIMATYADEIYQDWIEDKVCEAEYLYGRD